MLRSRRLEMPILQGFLSVKIAKTVFYTFALKNGLLLRNTAIENWITATFTVALPSRKSWKGLPAFSFAKIRKESLCRKPHRQPLKTTAALKPQTVKRKIGKTTYELSLHFSQTSAERMNDKVMRLLENDLSAKKWGKLFSMSLTNRPKRHRLGGVRENAGAGRPEAG